jgi:hypothetical protein
MLPMDGFLRHFYRKNTGSTYCDCKLHENLVNTGNRAFRNVA